MIASRRRFLLGAGALLAAPAIVRVSSLMAVKPVAEFDWAAWVERDIARSLERSRQAMIDRWTQGTSLKVGDLVVHDGRHWSVVASVSADRVTLQNQ